MGELNIYGVYVPVLVIQAVLAYIVLRLLMLVTDPWVDKGWIFLPSIFYLCLYITVLGMVHWGFIVSFA